MNSSESGEWVIPQHKIMTKLDLMELRLMKLASEVNTYKEELIEQNVVLSNIQDTVTNMQDIMNKQEESKDDDLKTMVKEIKKSHEKLQDNLSSIYFKQRRDNIFWRSYNNKFSNNCNNLMGFKEMLLGSDPSASNKNDSTPPSKETTPVLKMKRRTHPSTPPVKVTLAGTHS